MKRLISHVRLLFNIRLVHLFSNTYETARYNMIIHVIVFLVLIPSEFTLFIPDAVIHIQIPACRYPKTVIGERHVNVLIKTETECKTKPVL